MFSKQLSYHISNKEALGFYSAIFETETPDGLKTKRENVYPHNPVEIDLVLRYLSVHSADVDPRMICMIPDLYWNIIWYHGSITKALKFAGGQRLYEIGFGKHRYLVRCPPRFSSQRGSGRELAAANRGSRGLRPAYSCSP